MIHIHKYSNWKLLYSRQYRNDWGSKYPQRVYEAFCERCGKPKIKELKA